MKHSYGIFLPAIVFLLFIPVTPGNAESPPPSNSILLLKTVHRINNPVTPWSVPVTEERNSNAVIVGKDWVFTDSESVRYSVYIEVKNPLSGAVSEATVKYFGFDCGLALLELKSPEVLSGLKGLDLYTDSLNSGEEIIIEGSEGWTSKPIQLFERVYNIKKSLPVFSHIDYMNLIYFKDTSAIRIQSGAAVIKSGKLAGIYESYSNRKLSYTVPASEIDRFLRDITDGTYDGKPALDALTVPLIAPTVKKYYFLDDNESGILLQRLAPGYDPLREGDVVLKVNGMNFNQDGLLSEASGKFTDFSDYLRNSITGDYKFTVKRTGTLTELNVKLKSPESLRYKRKSSYSDRRYYLKAGLAFGTLDFDTLNSFSGSPNSENLMYRYKYRTPDQLFLQTDEEVILLSVLDDKSVNEYNSFAGQIVYRINNKRIRSIQDLMESWKNIIDRYIIIEFLNNPRLLVIDRDSAWEIDRRINDRYHPQENGRVY